MNISYSKKSSVFLFLFFSLSFLPLVTASAANFNLEVSPVKMNLDVERGTTHAQTFRVGNYSGSGKRLYIYVQDFVVRNAEGSPEFFEHNLESNNKFSLREWVTLPFTEIFVEDNTVEEFDVTVNIPEDAEPGGHYAALFVQSEKPVEEGEVVVGAISRIAALMLINVPGDVDRQLLLDNLSTDKKIYFNEVPEVTITALLRNTGNAHVIPTGAVFVSGGYGAVPKSILFNTAQSVIMPEAPARKISETFNFVRQGLIPPIGKFSIDFLAKYDQGKGTVTGYQTFWLIPLKFLSIVFASFLVSMFILWRVILSFKPREQVKKPLK